MRLLAEEHTIAWTLLVGEYNMTQDRGWGERQLLRTNNQDVRQVLPGICMKEGPPPFQQEYGLAPSGASPGREDKMICTKPIWLAP